MTTFWDEREKLTPKRKPRATRKVEGAGGAPEVWDVATFVERVNACLRKGLVTPLRVRGEITAWRRHVSGHCYFTLKDPSRDANVEAVMYDRAARSLAAEPSPGAVVVVEGVCDVWERRGSFSLKVERLSDGGAGDALARLERVREQLRAEGLFDASRKRPLPPYPQTVAFVTSAQAAGFEDVLRVFRDAPSVRTLLLPVAVQGDAAADAVADALDLIGRCHRDVGGVDVVLLVRGGGSREDLMAFNDEKVARAVAACGVPVVTGIGHETDTHLADLAADHHAHTPTMAAKVVLAGWLAAGDRLGQYRTRLNTAMRSVGRRVKGDLTRVASHVMFRRPDDPVDDAARDLDDAVLRLRDAWVTRRREASDLLRALADKIRGCDPRHRLALRRDRLNNAAARLDAAAGRAQSAGRLRVVSAASGLHAMRDVAVRRGGERLQRLEANLRRRDPASDVVAAEARVARLGHALTSAVLRRHDAHSRRLDAERRTLDVLDPTRVLARGYSLTTDVDGRVVRVPGDVRTGDLLTTRLAGGSVTSRVTS